MLDAYYTILIKEEQPVADRNQLHILRQGADTWKQWRLEHPDVRPDLHGANLRKTKLSWVDLSKSDLSEVGLRDADLQGARLSCSSLYGAHLSWANLLEADLREADLRGADLVGTRLCRADLRRANISGAHLSNADLREAILDGADLSRADLSGTNLSGADVCGVNLSGANLGGAQIHGAHLCRANLHSADLRGAYFHGADLNEADLSNTEIGSTVFSAVDLSKVEGLQTVRHVGPSTIGIDTIYRSGARIPEIFLRGAGLPDTFIVYMGSLVGRPIEFYSCFISYSSKDQAFADRLHADMQAKGVRCWFAPEDMKIGDKIWDRLDQSIRLHDKLLVILSANSIGSAWVEDEVMTAFEEERKRHQTVLFPVRLDDAVMASNEAWAGLVRQRHIGDFRAWKEHDAYRAGFEKLMRDLKAG